MSTLMHRLDDSIRLSERRAIKIGTARTHLPTARQFYLGALTMLLAGGLLVGLIVIRTAIFYSRFHY